MSRRPRIYVPSDARNRSDADNRTTARQRTDAWARQAPRPWPESAQVLADVFAAADPAAALSELMAGGPEPDFLLLGDDTGPGLTDKVGSIDFAESTFGGTYSHSNSDFSGDAVNTVAIAYNETGKLQAASADSLNFSGAFALLIVGGDYSYTANRNFIGKREAVSPFEGWEMISTGNSMNIAIDDGANLVQPAVSFAGVDAFLALAKFDPSTRIDLWTNAGSQSITVGVPAAPDTGALSGKAIQASIGAARINGNAWDVALVAAWWAGSLPGQTEHDALQSALGL